MDLDGILLIDKKVGHTSYETVKKVKGKLGARKAGHSGTLDKSASGLLIVCINKGTMVQNVLLDQYKRYRAKLFFGIETDTLDRYGQVVKTGAVNRFSQDTIQRVLGSFTGKIDQVPPVFSALHQNGKRMYKMALRGEDIMLTPRQVEIKEISLVKKENSRIIIDVLSSKGTYIRSLARDIAAALGTCGYLEELRRTAIGPFSVDDAYTLDEITPGISPIPLNEALSTLPEVEVEDDAVPLILNGVSVKQIFRSSSLLRQKGYIRILHRGRLIGIIQGGEKPGYFRVFRGGS